MTREELMQKPETKRFLQYVRIRYGHDTVVTKEILAVLDAHDAIYPPGSNIAQSFPEDMGLGNGHCIHSDQGICTRCLG